MSSATIPAAPSAQPPRSAPLRPFLNPALDYLLIGGGLSLVVLPVLLASGSRISGALLAYLPWFLLLSNGAHFASSTMRLYLKPGARAALPFLTMGLPLVALAVVVAGLAFPATLGNGLVRLYLTWSPYHYAAQAYGIAVVYAFRSGIAPEGTGKKLLWWTSMLPFFHAFLAQPGIGTSWLLPEAWLRAPIASSVIAALIAGLKGASFAAPIGLAAFLALRGKPLPIISVLTVLVNAAWWILLPFWDAFVWATVFHGIQYLAIVTTFHVRDQVSQPANAHRPAWHVATFYAACVALGWLLFQVLPEAGLAVGFGAVESVLIVVAAINIHHFIVDAYIWRLKPGDTNRKIVETQAQAPG